MKIRNTGVIFMTAGIVMILSAVLIILYNCGCDKKAGSASADILTDIKQSITARQEEEHMTGHVQSNYENENNSTHKQVIRCSEDEYIGILSIPSLGLELPVSSEWSYKALKISPCRYSGTADEGNLIIAAHNYPSHFGKIENLSSGDSVIFTDASGKEYRYQTVCTEIITADDTQQMNNGEWDMSLFTCTLSGKDRITVRCSKTFVK